LKKNLFLVPALLLGGAFLAQAQGAAPVKIGILHVQAAIVNTQEGKKAADGMNAKFTPKKTELDKKQSEIDAQEEKLRKGSATLSEDAKGQLMNSIDKGKKQLQRDSQDAQSEFEEEENKVFNELGAKLYAVVEKYAKDNGYTMIIDVSAQGQPVWWASDSINITQDIIAAYDKANPSSGGATTAPTKAPAAPITPTRPPVTTAPPKKQ
jgi:outer membrane protein